MKMKIKKALIYSLLLISSSSYAKTYIFMDIDNTLFKNGKPIHEMIEKTKELQKQEDVELFFLSGRNKSESLFSQIQEWLKNQNLSNTDTHLILKPKTEFNTAKFKYNFVVKQLKLKDSDFAIIVDDNKNNFKHFREPNVKTITVQSGKYKEAVDEIVEVLASVKNRNE